jgi:hypothetical protein
LLLTPVDVTHGFADLQASLLVECRESIVEVNSVGDRGAKLVREERTFPSTRLAKERVL